MRRPLLALTLLVGLLVFPSSASATHDLLGFQSAVDAMLEADPTLDPPPDDPTKDFAVGGFQSDFADQKIGFSAHRDGPKAEDAWGHMSATRVESGLKARWRVVCLAVLGQKASLGLEPQDSSANQSVEHVFLVRDTGLPGGTGDTFEFLPDVSPQNCERGLLVGEPFFPIGRGNILVHDSQP